MTPRTTPSSTRSVELFYRLLIPVALTCFVGAVVSDWAYERTATILYSNLSAWLLLFGLVSSGIAIALFALSLLGGWLEPRARGFAGLLFVIGFAVEIVNFMVHNRDGWTTVVPTGFILSVVGAAVMLAAAWFARTPVVEGGAA